MPWQSHLDGGNHLGQVEAGTAAESAPGLPAETPTGTPNVPQPAPAVRIGVKEIVIVIAVAAAVYFVMKKMKK